VNDELDQEELPSVGLALAMPISLIVTVFAFGFGLLIALGYDEGGEATPTTQTTQPPGSAEGEEAFAAQGCGGCHTLTAAGASGAIAPNLDETQLTTEQIADVIANGRPATAMRAYRDELSAEQLESLAAYIKASAP
jgi:mono/diheme cytochrome c family protein